MTTFAELPRSELRRDEAVDAAVRTLAELLHVSTAHSDTSEAALLCQVARALSWHPRVWAAASAEPELQGNLDALLVGCTSNRLNYVCATKVSQLADAQARLQRCSPLFWREVATSDSVVYNPSCVANIVAACSKLCALQQHAAVGQSGLQALMMTPGLAERLVSLCNEHAGGMTAHETARSLESLAQLRLAPGEAHLRHVSTWLAAPQSLDVHDVADTLSALGKLTTPPTAQLRSDAVIAAMERTTPQAPAGAVVAMFESLHCLDVPPTPALQDALFAATLRDRECMHGQHATRLLGALAAMGVAPPAEVAEALMSVFIRLPSRASADDAVQMVTALARLSLAPSDALLNALAVVLRQSATVLSGQDVTALLAGLASLRVRPTRALADVLQAESQRAWCRLTEAEAADVCSAMGSLGMSQAYEAAVRAQALVNAAADSAGQWGALKGSRTRRQEQPRLAAAAERAPQWAAPSGGLEAPSPPVHGGARATRPAPARARATPPRRSSAAHSLSASDEEVSDDGYHAWDTDADPERLGSRVSRSARLCQVDGGTNCTDPRQGARDHDAQNLP